MKILVLQLLFLFLTLFAVGQSNKIVKKKLFINKTKYDSEIRITDKLIKKKQAKNIYYYEKAYDEQQKKLFDSSILSATIALKMTSQSDTLYPSILLLRAFSYANAGKLDLGIADNETLVKAFPNDVYYLLNMSFLYGENKQFNNCLKTLEQAYTIDSSNVYIINNLAYYNNETKNYESTIKYATKGLTLSKDSVNIASLLNSLGFAQAKTISLDKGLQTIKQSITYKPNNLYAFFNLGLIYLDKKENMEACKNFKIARELGGINLTEEYLKKYCN